MRTDRARDDGRTRVYRLNVSHQAVGSPLRVSLGRQVSPDLASVSLFDGALAEYGRATVAWGLFGGTQPDPESYGYSTRVLEYGTYARVQSPQGTPSGGRPPLAASDPWWTARAIGTMSFCAGSS